MLTQTELTIVTRSATLDDVGIITELDNIVSIADVGNAESTENEIRLELMMEGFVLERDTHLIFTPEGQLIGFMLYFDTEEPHVHGYLWSRIHPEFEGLGVRAMLLDWADQRAQETIGMAPPEAKVALVQGTLSTKTRVADELKQHGYSLVRHFWRMVIELTEQPPTPVLPAGIIIRPYHAETELPAVLHALRDSFKDHWGYVESPFEQELRNWQKYISEMETYDPALFLVAMDGDEIAGISLNWTHIPEDHAMGWVGTLGVRRAWRRKGIALALLHYSFNDFYRRGQKRVGLGVDATSLTGAMDLYKQAGMKSVRQFDRYQKVMRHGIDLSTQSVE